jgi:hypothetical protein
LALCSSLAAQLTTRVQGATATQVLLYYTAPNTSACNVQVSESATYSPLVADVDPTLFTGAGSDTMYDILPAGTARLLRIGMRTSTIALDGRRHSRALAANTQHYVQITCGSVTGTTSFVTGVPRGFAPEPLPTDPTAWGNLAYPEFDFTDLSKPVIDPQTGIRIYTADPKTWSMSAVLPLSAGWYGGGNGWLGAANISSYSSAVATTYNTNPLIIYLNAGAFNDQTYFASGYWPYDNFLDLGVDLYGSASDGQTAANRTVQLALSLDSGQTAYTNWVSAVLPALAGFAGTFPAQYPSAYFAGWGKALPRNSWPRRYGTVTVSSSLVTLTLNDQGNPLGSSQHDADSYFDSEWSSGTKIFIANSAPACANNFCTIASVQDAQHLTIRENLTLSGGNFYQSANLAVIVQKTTASGSVSLSAQVRLAKGYPQDVWSGGCSGTAVTSGDGIVGYPCIFPSVRQNPGGLYFVGTSTPVLRLVSVFGNPGSIPGTSGADQPNGATALLGPTVGSFDPTDPATIYTVLGTNGGSIGLFKIHYTGNWSVLNIAYQSTSVTPPKTGELTWQNMTPSATGRDMRSQILANTTYNEATWGALTSLQGVGMSGQYAVFIHLIGGQDTACWIFEFDASTGNFYRAFRTDDGSSIPGLKFAGCHNVSPIGGGALLLSSNGLRLDNTAVPYGGPFTAPITAVQRNGVFDTSNTALPWPPASPPAANGYDTACPANLNPAWIANGAVGNQCVTVQMKEPCSAFATAGELAASPCPWDPTKSMVAPLAEGDFLKQSSLGPAGYVSWDGEGYMVVQITPLGFGVIQAVLQRNANYSYCAMGKDGSGAQSQYTPSNGWAADAVPPFSCASVLIAVDTVANASYVVNDNLVRGHFTLTGAGPGAYTWIGQTLVGSTLNYSLDYNRPLPLSWQPLDYVVPSAPPFAGYNSYHDIQSYINASQSAATPDLRQYGFDFRHYNGDTGVDYEWPNQTIGSPTNPTLQAGTTTVYQLTYSGTADAKHGVINVWAGEKYLIEQSSPTMGNTLTDANPWHFCYAYQAGECRAGSSAGNLYAAIPGATLQPSCWASQINSHIPCAMAGPDQAMRSTQVRISAPDPAGAGQRTLSSLLMGPGQQYVYSSVEATPDGSYLLFAGFLTSGYHTSMMMAQVPPMPDDSIAATYVPVIVSGQSGSAVYVEFGYEEYGANTDFHCTPRQESCRVASSSINESMPFWFAHELFPPATGTYQISIPALPGRILYYHVVDGGVAGPLQAMTTPLRRR